MEDVKATPRDDAPDFTWLVSGGGYRWVDPHEGPEQADGGTSDPVLIDVNAPAIVAGDADRWLSAEDVPGFYRHFASLNPTTDEILAFATKYGMLGLASQWVPVATTNAADQGEVDPAEPVGRFGEPLSAWRAEIEAANDALLVWSFYRHGAHQDLRDYLRQFVDPPHFETYGGRLVPRLGDDDRDAALWFVVQMRVMEVVNDRLRRFIAPQLFPSDPSPGAAFQSRDTPSSLIGLIWYQIRDVVSDRRGLRRCICGEWIETGPGKGRPDKRYCSEQCKARAARERRKAHVKELEELAAQVGHDLVTNSRRDQRE